MRPAALSSATLATLRCDQRLRGRRGTYFCRKKTSSRDLRRPEIQPKQRPTSTASSAVKDGMPEPFFAIFSHTPT
jgi:hypothetical protein